MKPHEIERHQAQANHLEIVLHLRADLFWFRGHFAVQPLLPGVAQIDWAMSYALTLLARLAFSLYSEHQIPVPVAAGQPRHAHA